MNPAALGRLMSVGMADAVPMIITVEHPDGDLDRFELAGEEAELILMRNGARANHGRLGKVAVLAILALIISGNQKADMDQHQEQFAPWVRRMLRQRRNAKS